MSGKRLYLSGLTGNLSHLPKGQVLRLYQSRFINQIDSVELSPAYYHRSFDMNLWKQLQRLVIIFVTEAQDKRKGRCAARVLSDKKNKTKQRGFWSWKMFQGERRGAAQHE